MIALTHGGLIRKLNLTTLVNYHALLKVNQLKFLKYVNVKTQHMKELISLTLAS